MLRLAQELAEPLSRDEATRALHRVGVRDRRDGRARRASSSTRSSGGCCSPAGTSRRPTPRSRRRRCARRARRPRSRSSCIRRRRGRSTSTSTRSPSGRASRRTGTSTFATCVVGRGEPCAGAAWHPLGAAGDGSVDAARGEGVGAQKPGRRAELERARAAGPATGSRTL